MLPDASAINSGPLSQPAQRAEGDEQIDRILLLAKLGSDPRSIDPMLDDLRRITAGWNRVEPLSESRLITLRQLEANLKNYLINSDPLRRFTSETLEARLQNQRGDAPGESKRDLAIVSCASLLAAVAALLLNKSVLLTIPFFLVTLHIGIAWLYLSALVNFKKEFRQAFIYICIGIVLLSVAFSHYIAIELLKLGEYQLFRYGGITALATICYVFMYIGLRKYAGLLGIKSFFTSLPKLLGVSLAVVAAAILVPHTGQQTFEPYFDFSLACIWLFTMFLAFGVGVSRQITKSVTPAYAKSMKWLHIYLILGCVGSLGSALGLPIMGQLNGSALYILIAALGIGPQLILLYTGYSFKKETGA